MGQRRGVIRKINPVRSVGFDQRRWPVFVALVALASVSVALVVANSAFDDPRPLDNGWFRLAMLTFGFACLCTLIFLLETQLTRRSQLALVLSVICHVLLSGVLYQQYLDLPVIRVADMTAPDPEEEPAVVAEYHVRPTNQKPLAEAFERPQPVEAPEAQAVAPTRQEAQARPAEARQQLSTLPETEPAIEPTPVVQQRPVAAASHRAPDPSQLTRRMDPATAPWTDAPQPRAEAGATLVQNPAPQTLPTARRATSVRVPKAAALERQLATDRDAVIEPQTVRQARRELPSAAANRSALAATPITRASETYAAAVAPSVTEAAIPLAVVGRQPAPRPAVTSAQRTRLKERQSASEPGPTPAADVQVAAQVPEVKRQSDAPRAAPGAATALARTAEPAVAADPQGVASLPMASVAQFASRRTPQPAAGATARRRARGQGRTGAEGGPLLRTTQVAVQPPSPRGDRSGSIETVGTRQRAAGGVALKRTPAAAAGIAGAADTVAAAGSPSQSVATVQVRPRAAGDRAATPAGIPAATRQATRAFRSMAAGASALIDIPTTLAVRQPSPRRDAFGRLANGGAAVIARGRSELRRAQTAAAAASGAAEPSAAEGSPSEPTFAAAAGTQSAAPAVRDRPSTQLGRTAPAAPGPPRVLASAATSLAAAVGTRFPSPSPAPSLSRRAAAHGAALPQLAGGVTGSPHRKATAASLPGQVAATAPGVVSLSDYAEVSSPAAETAAGRLGRVRGTLLVPAVAVLGTGGLATLPSPQAGLPHRKAQRESEIVHYRPDKYPQRKFGGPAVASGRARDVAAAFVRRGARQRKINEGGNGQPLPKTEAAIELGLAFLARQQLADGHWSFRSPADVPGNAARGGGIQADTAATGLSLLAFLGAGYDHYDDQYQQVVRRGLSYLVDHQQPSGALYQDHQRESDRVAQMYSHGIATIALCEAVGMTGDPALRPAAQRAIDFVVAAQHPQRGGWRYQPRRSSDLSVTGWQLMALKSGQLAGMHVPPAAYRNVIAFLDRCQGTGSQRALFVYNPYAANTPQQRHGRQPSTVMTAIGLLMRLYTGRDRTDPDIQRGAAHLLANLPTIATPAPTGSLDNPMRDTYYWYHATQVMFHMRGRYWNAWHNALHAVLIDSQVKSGVQAGSWDSRRPVPDRWGYQGGDLLMTAMNLLSLEVTYRHLPIYENTLDRPSKLATAGQ